MFNKIFFSLIGILALFTLVLPYLVSARSNELTILGVLIIIALFYKLGQIVVQSFKEKK